MGQRIGAGWKNADGKMNGQIEAPAGVCIPANAKGVMFSVVVNETKKTDKSPDFFIELWEKTEGAR